jgi:hypothetical protein
MSCISLTGACIYDLGPMKEEKKKATIFIYKFRKEKLFLGLIKHPNMKTYGGVKV